MEGLKTGRIVYYVAYGTPGGEFPAGVERAAVVTEVPGAIDQNGNPLIGLCVLNPTGLFFNRGVRYDEAGAPGTWHWMFPGQSTRYIPDRMEAPVTPGANMAGPPTPPAPASWSQTASAGSTPDPSQGASDASPTPSAPAPMTNEKGWPIG